MKNKLTDLNNHLFEALERLNNEHLKGEDLEIEVVKSKAITDVSKEIISNARLVLDAHVKQGNILASTPLPVMLTSKS